MKQNRISVRPFLVPLLLVILSATPFQADDIQWRTVQRVVDGDTVELDGKEKVRLIGVDTPEKFSSKKLDADARESNRDKETIKALGERASKFTKELCEGKKVWLEYGQEKSDRYGRTLAYLHLEDGTVVNEEIIRQGFGNAYTKYPHKYLEAYRELEKEAREGEKGLWGDDADKK